VGLGGATASTDGGAVVTHAAGLSVDLWAVAYQGLSGWAAGDHGAIFHTVDGGSTFTAQTSGTDANLRGIAFSDANNGIAIGEFGSILSTHDGGSSWVATPASGKEFPSAATANGSTWWVASANGGLWSSSDGARTFVKQSTPDGVFRAIAFSSDHTIGFAVGDAGVVIATTDGGATWTARDRAPATLRAVAIAPLHDAVIAVGDAGTMWRSTDGGTSWNALEAPASVHLYGAAFTAGSLETWVVGESGTVLHGSGSDALTALATPAQTTWTAIVRPE
jgi:photosystem II stability/assembly factor-like uncharacterized protein